MWDWRAHWQLLPAWHLLSKLSAASLRGAASRRHSRQSAARLGRITAGLANMMLLGESARHSEEKHGAKAAARQWFLLPPHPALLSPPAPQQGRQVGGAAKQGGGGIPRAYAWLQLYCCGEDPCKGWLSTKQQSKAQPRKHSPPQPRGC